MRIQGKRSHDQRGSVAFVNYFSFKGVKRFYQVENKNKKFIRAFHGHMKEAKYVYVVKGKILLCAVHLTDNVSPSKDENVYKFELSATKPQVIYIPPSFANGFMNLTKDARVIFFSTATLQESLQDDYRFPSDYWGKDVWNI